MKYVRFKSNIHGFRGVIAYYLNVFKYLNIAIDASVIPLSVGKISHN